MKLATRAICVLAMMSVASSVLGVSSVSAQTAQQDTGTVISESIDGVQGVQVHYLSGDKVVARTGLGAPRVLPTGRYRMRVLQGTREIGVSPFFDLRANQTLKVPSFYGALSLRAVNARGQMIQQPYRVFQVGKSTPVVAERTPVLAGRVPVFLVSSGEHQLILGSNARGIALTLWFPAGRHLSYQAHMHRGQLTRFARWSKAPKNKIKTDIFQPLWRVSGDLALERGRYGLGVFNGDVLRFGGVSDTKFRWRWTTQQLGLGVRFEQSWLSARRAQGDGIGYEKLVDELKLSARYQWQLKPWLQVYGHSWVKAPAFGTYYEPAASASVILSDARGRTGVIPLSVGQRLRLWRPFTPLFAQQGLGVMLNPWDGPEGYMKVYTGLATRQSMYRGGFYLIDQRDRTFQAFRPEDGQYWGAETGLLFGFYVTNALKVDAGVEAFWSYDPMVEAQSVVPVFSGELGVSLDLSQYAALHYAYRLNQEDFSLPRAQQRHTLSLRLIYDIL